MPADTPAHTPAPRTTPPFPIREAHAHLAQTGRAERMLDLARAASATDAAERIAQATRELPPHQPLLAHSLRPEAWDNPAWPTRDQLDRAAPHNPVCLWCFDYHALAANTAMLALAGVTDATNDPAGGSFQRNHAGSLTGLCLEAAALHVWNAVPEPDETQRQDHLKAAFQRFADLGFAEVHDLKAQPWLPAALAQLERAGELTLRVHLYPLVEHLPAIAANRASFESDRIRLAGGKLFADGTLNSRTAWMLDPYADAPPDRPRGTPMVTPDDIDNAIRTCDEHNLPLATHAIGDAAVRAVLDAIERVKPRTAGQRIEHAELIHEQDTPRFAQLGVTCSPQPCHLLPDIEALARAVPDRLHRVLPIKELIDLGLTPGQTLIFGSDSPIVRPEPQDSVLAATTRTRPGAATTIAPEQAITEDQAWAAFKTHA